MMNISVIMLKLSNFLVNEMIINFITKIKLPSIASPSDSDLSEPDCSSSTSSNTNDWVGILQWLMLVTLFIVVSNFSSKLYGFFRVAVTFLSTFLNLTSEHWTCDSICNVSWLTK